jgi:hypothetical protein
MRRLAERIDVLVSASEKARITEAARAVGISTSAYMRQAAASYYATENEQVIDATLRKLSKSAERASTVVDDVLAWVEASNERIAELERAAARDRTGNPTG